MKFKASANERGGGSSGKLFLKLKPGESVKVIFRGEPYEFYSKFKDGKSTVVESSGDGAKWRFRSNVIIKEDGSYQTKILEGGSMIADALESLSEDYDLNNTVIKLTRNGSGLDTTYAVIPMPGGLDPKVKSEISKLSLHDLSLKKREVASIPEFDSAPMPSFDDAEEIPF